MTPHLRDLLLAGLAGCLFAACGSTSLHVETHDMDPLIFESRQDERGETQIEVRDPAAEFDHASALMDASAYHQAALAFAAVADLAPGSRIGRSARFNAGLCHEYAEEPEAAATQYRKALAAAREEAGDNRIRFRLVAVLERLEIWPEVVRVLKPLAERALVPPDTLAVRVRLGHALLERGDAKEARTWLERAVSFWKRHQDLQVLRTSPLISRARFDLARILERRFAALRLRLPLPRMAEDLKEKTRLFAEAQQAYLAVVRLPSLRYAVAAGHAIGHLYEQLYDGLLGAEVPPRLSPEDLKVYDEELRKKIRPLLFKAAEIYQTNLRLAARSGHHSTWTDQTRQAIEKVRARIETDLAHDGPPMKMAN